MSHCIYCGQQVPDDSKFCPSCGARTNDNDDSAEAVSRADQPDEDVQLTTHDPELVGSATVVWKWSKRTWVILAAALCVILVLVAGGIFGYNYYTTHSHPYAQFRYEESTKQLVQAKEALRDAVAKADESVNTISADNMDQPSLLEQYKTNVNAAGIYMTAELKTITEPKAADTSELLEVAEVNTKAASSMNETAAELTETAASIVESKTRADDILTEPEKAVSAAEKQKQVNDKELASHKLDMNAIVAGDYSSLDGTWTNPAGSWMKIADGRLTPKTPVEGTTGPYTLRECRSGSYGSALESACVQHEMPATQHQLVQEGALRDNGGWTPNDQFVIVAVQEGAELYNTAFFHTVVDADPTDQSEDRIIPTFSSGEGYGTICADVNCAYYRDPSSLTVSRESQDKLQSAIDNAQQAVDKLDQDWAKPTKDRLQCRIDVANGEDKECSDTQNDSVPSTGVVDVQSIKNGDFSSIAGKWCDGDNNCITIGKDGTYEPVPDRNHGKLIIPSGTWISGGVGKSGVVELMDVNGPQCTDSYVSVCSYADSVWPIDFIYYPAEVYPVPNADIEGAFSSNEDQDEVAKNLDVSKPYMQLMAGKMNDPPTTKTSYHFVGSESSTDTEQSGMSLNQLAQGDCSSIQGHWDSIGGGSYDYGATCPTGSYIDGSGNETDWQLPEIHEYYAVQSNTSHTAGGGDRRVYLPAGRELPREYLNCYGASKDNSDIGKDRIFQVGGIACQMDRDPARLALYKQ